MADAVGPVFTGGFESFVINDASGEQYTITYLPDRNNYQLQREGKPPVYYYLPEQVRLARKGDKGDYLFRHIHFVGVFDETNIGIEKGETQGGVISFTTTSRFPTSVLKQSQDKLIAKFDGKGDKYWGIRTRIPPLFRVAPIVKNITAVSNVFPNADGSIPQDAAPGAAPGGGAPAGGQGSAPGARSAVMRGGSPYEPVPHGRDFHSPLAVNPWAFKLDGQGDGSITGGENAYAGFLGPIASEVLWAGFHGVYSPLTVTQHLLLPMWSQLMRVKITGKWKRIFDHFSAAASAQYLWFSADIKAEFNQLRLNGDIKVEVDLDGTAPGAQEMERAINQRIDMIVQQFTEIAKKVIFDPPMPQVEPAQAPSGGFFSSLFGGGGGLALKARHDATYVDLNYEETRPFRYLQPHTIGSSLEGFFNEIKRDPQAEQKYFQRLVLGELGRKVMRIFKPVVNWPNRAKQWAGEPVAFLSAQVGYPGEKGEIVWKPNTFQASDPADATWRPVFVQWRKGEIKNPPQGWDPDETFVKRKVHMLEPPGENEYPFTKVYVEQNVIDLDPGPNGTLTNDNILEVRADEVGTLDVGPIELGAALESSSQVIEVEFRAKGRTAAGADRMTKSSRFRWAFADQFEPRYWRIFTGQHDFVPAYQYRVHVTVKGTLFNRGQAWSGPWTDGGGNGALMIDVPAPDSPGVVMRSLTSREIFSDDVVCAADYVAFDGPGAPSAPDDGHVPALPPGAPAPVVAAPGVPANGNGGATAPRSGIRSDSDKDRSVQGYEIEPDYSRSAAGYGDLEHAPQPDRKADGWVETPAYDSGRGRRGNKREGVAEDTGDWVEMPS